MRIIGNNPAADNAEITAVASGTLPSGQSVIVNADGTVSVAAETAVSQAVGDSTVFQSGNTETTSAAYDANAQRVVVAYLDEPYQLGKAVVGTVSGTDISFGTPVTFQASNVEYTSTVYDANAQKVVIVYSDGVAEQGKAVVGTVSGTSISFGSAVVFDSTARTFIETTYDSDAQKIVIAYANNNSHGKAVVGTVSGTNISFGSIATFYGSSAMDISIAYDSNAQRAVISYRAHSNSGYGTSIVGTISGTNISFGSAVVFESAAVDDTETVYDSNAQKIVVFYQDEANSDYGTAIVGTVSGTTISFGTAVVFESAAIAETAATYDSNAQKVVIAYRDGGNSNKGTLAVGTVSGTSISFGTPVVFETGATYKVSTTYDSNAQRVVVAYRDNNDSLNGKAAVFRNAYTSTNLTAENFIGFAGGAVEEISSSIGATSVVNTGTNGGQAIAYDTNSDRVVIAYKDNSNGYGKAVVGTVSGSGISFGTPVTFNGASTIGMQPSHGIAFDSSNNRVVIVYKDNGNNSYGTAIVGTVNPSNNSISFGSEAVFESAHTTFPVVTFDSSNNKVLISYSDYGDSSKGKAIVGTVSNASISFGSAAEFEAGDVNHETLMSTFDSANNKVVIAYKDVGDSNKGKAVVATISGTSVSFGTPVEFTASDFVHSSITFDSTSNKVILVYRDSGNSAYGTAKAGTVSGTSISFGNAIIYNSGDSQRNSVSYSPTADKSVVFFRDGAASDIGKLVEFTVSGTASSAQQFSATTTSASSSVFDPDNSVVVNAYIDAGNSTDLETVLFTGTTITRAEVASGSNAVIDIGSAISTNQLSLTAGQQYFVQTDGTLGLTAADPSVIAGTAISATEIIVKG